MRAPPHLLSAAAWALGIAAVVTLPLLPALAGAEVLGHPTGDLADHVQGAWAAGQSLLDLRRPDLTALSHFPAPLRLWFVDPVGALMALPLWGLGAHVAWGAVLFMQVALAAGVAFLAGRDLGGTYAGGATAAVVVGGSPYVLGLLHSGLSEYLGLAPVVGGVWALLRLTGRDPRGRPAPRMTWAWAGSCIGLSTLQAPYYGLFLGLVALCCLPGRGWRDRLEELSQALVLGAVLSLPTLWLLTDALGDPAGAVTAANAPAWQQGRWPGVDVLGWFVPGHLFPDTPALGNPGVLQVHRLSLAAVAIGLLAAARPHPDAPAARKLLLPLGLMLLLGLGPVLTFDGQTPLVAGQPIPLPLGALYVLDTPLRMLHHPYRLAAVVLPLLGALAAVGVGVLPRGIRFTVPAVILVEGLLGGPVPWPLPTTDLRAPAVLTALPAGPVLEWPPDATDANRAYQLAQPAHGRPIPYGVNVFVNEALRGDPLVEDLLTAFDDVGGRGRNRDAPGPPLAPIAPRPGDTGLAALGFRAVVLYPGRLNERERKKTLRRLENHLGPAHVEVDGALGWGLAPARGGIGEGGDGVR